MSTSAACKDHPGIPEEIQIHVPWGHLSGLAWGPANGLPVLCLHGWMDNANTFLRLVPMLPADRRYIAIEFSGHGRSSHLPKGVFYDQKIYLNDVYRTVEALKYSRVSIIGHSMGGIIGSLFSCMFPEMVDKLILLDSFGFLLLPAEKIIPYKRNLMHEQFTLERKQGHKVYSQDGALRRLLEANTDLSAETGKILLERGTKKVPEGFIFSRDIQVSVHYDPFTTVEQCLGFLNNIQARVLTLIATNWMGKKAEEPTDMGALFRILVSGFKLGLKERYQLVWIEGGHHVHLNEPEKVAGLISRFLQTEDGCSATVQSRL